jgi:Ca2+-transporting ATPase
MPMQTCACFDDTAEVVTLFPGYLRIRLPRLFQCEPERQIIEQSLSGSPGIAEVHANPLTGKVLILFDPAIATDDMLAELGITPAAKQAPPDGVAGGAQEGGREAGPAGQTRAAKPDDRVEARWHSMPETDVLSRFGTDIRSGLGTAVAEDRLQQGLNVLPQKKAEPAYRLFLDQFKGLPVVLLGVSAALSLLTGGLAEAAAIVAVLGMNAGIGFVTERRAEQTIASLSELMDEAVPVIRDGKVTEIASSHIVPGDLLVLSPGVHVAADARVVHATELMMDESALTGESRFVPKFGAVLPHAVPLAERGNMVYMGTAVAAGRGLAVVSATGADTEIGWVQTLVANAEPPKTPIQRQLDHLGNRLVMISSAICVLVFVIGLGRGRGALEMLKAAISLAIAAVPEGLPTVATTSFARGLRVMRAKQMLIRKLQAIETLGAIHTICFDKTGTLTLNRISVVELEAPSGMHRSECGAALALAHGQDPAPDIARLLELCVLSNENAAMQDMPGFLSSGSATENALVRFATDSGMSVPQTHRSYPLLQAELRAEGRNYMTTLHAIEGAERRLIAVKGSPMEVLGLCAWVQDGEHLAPLSEAWQAQIATRNAAMAARQLRVLGFAYVERPSAAASISDAKDLVWLGLVGMADPIRPNVDKVIADFHRAGIRTVMITGDQRMTACSIGECVGLGGRRSLHVLDSGNLDGADPAALRRLASEADVFARVSPGRKLQIVQALQGSGEVIAMTGDGINDGPALRAADIGIAMGREGTDLARSAADVVLKDDRLETVLDAIRQGRSITTNIRKSLEFLISSNLSEILVVLGAVSLTAASPLTPMQLLWINLLSDVLPAVALAAEPPESDVMRQPPRRPDAPIAGKSELLDYTRQGAWITGGTLGAYVYAMTRYGAGARSSGIAFNALMLGQLLHAFSCRSRVPDPVSAPEGKGESMLAGAVGGSIALQIAANFLPFLRSLLGLGHGLTPGDALAILAGAGLPFLVNEGVKNAGRRNGDDSQAADAASSAHP